MPVYRIAFITFITIIIGIFHGVAHTAHAQENNPSSADIDFAMLESAIEAHPQYLSLLSDGQASKSESISAGSLPDPMVSIGVDNYPINGGGFDEFLPTSKMLIVQQAIPNTSVRRAKSNHRLIEHEMDQLQAGWIKRRLRAQLIARLARLSSITDQLADIDAQFDLLSLEAGYWNDRLQSGVDVYTDVSEVDVRRAALTVDRSILTAERQTMVEEIKALTGYHLSDPIDINVLDPVNWPQDLIQLYPVQIVMNKVEQSDQIITQREAEFGPDWKIGLTYKQREDGKNFAGDDWLSGKVGFTIPLWYSSNQQPALAAAKTRHKSAEYRLDDTKRQWESTMNSLSRQIEEVHNSLDALQAQKNALNDKAASLNRSYEVGSAPLSAVFSTEYSLLEVERQFAKRRAQKIALTARFNSHFNVQETSNE